jgi:hypothetical protein
MSATLSPLVAKDSIGYGVIPNIRRGDVRGRHRSARAALRLSGTPAQLPRPLSYGPWALGIIGLILIGVGLFADRPGEIALAGIGFGAAMVIAGVLLPRMHGQLELGPSGVKGVVQGLPEALMVTAAMTAREVAEATIPADEPEKERKVNEAVGRVVTDWAA